MLIDGREVRVVGVLAPVEGRDEPLVEMPMRVYEQLPAPPTADPPVLMLRAERVETVEALKRTVERWATARHGDAVTVSATGRERLRSAAQGILIFKLLMGAFTAIALLVGGIGIMNVLLASVLERTREIGVRRAVGARRRDVVLQLLAESVAIALAGSLIGLAAGIGGAFVVTALMRARTEAPDLRRRHPRHDRRVDRRRHDHRPRLRRLSRPARREARARRRDPGGVAVTDPFGPLAPPPASVDPLGHPDEPVDARRCSVPHRSRGTRRSRGARRVRRPDQYWKKRGMP